MLHMFMIAKGNLQADMKRKLEYMNVKIAKIANTNLNALKRKEIRKFHSHKSLRQRDKSPLRTLPARLELSCE